VQHTVSTIKTLIIEALPSKYSKSVLETRLNDAIATFAKVSNLSQAKNLDELRCDSANKTEFDRMLLYCQYTFLSKERDTVIRKWGQSELSALTQFGRLLCKKWFD
jgi:hypothetical protein